MADVEAEKKNVSELDLSGGISKMFSFTFKPVHFDTDTEDDRRLQTNFTSSTLNFQRSPHISSERSVCWVILTHNEEWPQEKV